MSNPLAFSFRFLNLLDSLLCEETLQPPSSGSQGEKDSDVGQRQPVFHVPIQRRSLVRPCSHDAARARATPTSVGIPATFSPLPADKSSNGGGNAVPYVYGKYLSSTAMS